MKPVVPAADAQLGVGAGGKQGGVLYNGMWVVSLPCVEAQLRGEESSNSSYGLGLTCMRDDCVQRSPF